MKLSNRTKENLSILFFIIGIMFLAVFGFCGGMFVQGTATAFSNTLFMVCGLGTAACVCIGLLLGR